MKIEHSKNNPHSKGDKVQLVYSVWQAEPTSVWIPKSIKILSIKSWPRDLFQAILEACLRHLLGFGRSTRRLQRPPWKILHAKHPQASERRSRLSHMLATLGHFLVATWLPP